jgi:hypothetical protein
MFRQDLTRIDMPKLSDYAFNEYSQFGEDGIIEKIIDILGASSKICLEVGAWDGLYLSNTARLWKNGWKAILIESDDEKYKTLTENVKTGDCHLIKSRISHEGNNTLENLLRKEGLGVSLDVLSIDIDGDDYYIFQSLHEIRPRLIICEYNPTIPAHIDLLAEPGNYFGCSVLALVKLAEAKGYKLVSVTECNCFFVREADFGKFSEYETSLQCLASTKHLTYLISGFSGDYVASRMPTYGCTVPSTQELRGEFFRIPCTSPTPQVKNNSLKQWLSSFIKTKSFSSLSRNLSSRSSEGK